jgi:hypothetical protein
MDNYDLKVETGAGDWLRQFQQMTP